MREHGPELTQRTVIVRDDAMQSRKTDDLYSGIEATLATGLLLSVVYCWVEYDAVARSTLVLWLLAVLALTLGRAALATLYRRSKSGGGTETGKWLWAFRGGVVASGSVWGSTAFLLFPLDRPQHLLFLVFILAGLTAGGVVSYAVDRFSAVAYPVLVLTPLMIRLASSHTSITIGMASAMALYLAFVVVHARYASARLKENIALRVGAVERENEMLASEKRYRLLLRNLPVGVFHYDNNLILTYCNGPLATLLRETREHLLGMDMNAVEDSRVLPALEAALEGRRGEYEGPYWKERPTDAAGWMSLVSAPARDANGQIIGGIGIVQDITELKRSRDQVEYMAYHDSLTGLPNRVLIVDRLSQALAQAQRSDRLVAVCFLDLDNFKPINDEFGHAFGDRVLQELSDRVFHNIRANDSIGRIGGDEFILLFTSLRTVEEYEFALRRIVGVISKPVTIANSRPVILGASIGVTLAPIDSVDPELLLSHADEAMYEAKRLGSNQICLYRSAQRGVNVD